MTNRMTSDCYDRLRGIQRHLAQCETWEPCFFIHPNTLTATAVCKAIRNGMDGILADLSVGQAVLDVLAKTDVPTVTIDVRSHRVCRRTHNYAAICCDDEAVARAAVRHFMEQGRFHAFAFCNLSISGEWVVIRKFVFSQVLAEKNLFCHIFDPAGTTTAEMAERELARWLRSLPKPAAVFAVNDDSAAKVLRAAARAKLKVPQQLAVVGSDNDELVCENTRPTISSIPPDFEEEGFLAAQTLDAIMNGVRKAGSGPILVPVKSTIVRESSASTAPADFLVRKALRFIDQNACSGIGVDDVARHLRISRRLLYLRFREIRNETVLDAIQARRLREVCNRLVTTHETIAVIAQACGYDDENHLMRLFRRRYGKTMSEWRRAQKTTMGQAP